MRGAVDLEHVTTDVAPAEDNRYSLGTEERQWRAVYAHYGYFTDDAYVQGRRVLKDGDPVTVMYFEGPAKEEVDTIYENTRQPETLDTKMLTVGTTPIPLSDVDMAVKRIHVKVPRSSPSIVYLGSSDKQDYVLEPGDIDVFEVRNPRSIYVRSLGQATIYVAFET